MVHLQLLAWYAREVRSELLGMGSAEEPKLDMRKRTRAVGPRPEDEKQWAAKLDLVPQQHQNLQEKLAEEKQGLAQSLNTNPLAAQNATTKDNQTLLHSLKMPDRNLKKLEIDSERQERHTQKSVPWLVWAMLITACFIFIGTIRFTPIMPRHK